MPLPPPCQGLDGKRPRIHGMERTSEFHQQKEVQVPYRLIYISDISTATGVQNVQSWNKVANVFLAHRGLVGTQETPQNEPRLYRQMT